MRKLVFAIAASIVIFALGFISAEFFRSSPALRQYTYLLLLREDSHFAGGRTHESSRVKEYSQWARAVAKTGTEITGEKLKLESRLINSAGVQNKIQDSDGVIAGFFLINARSDQDAIEKAFSCPHLRHGGNIELRRLDR
jgi:hypothetical protein